MVSPDAVGVGGLSLPQINEFLDGVRRLDSLSTHFDKEVYEYDLGEELSFLRNLDVGEFRIGLGDPDKEDPSPITMTNLGGVLEFGQGLTVSTDPTRLTVTTRQGAFLVGTAAVCVKTEHVINENLRFPELSTANDVNEVAVVRLSKDGKHTFWREQRYSFNFEELGYQERAYRRSHNGGDDWVIVREKRDEPLLTDRDSATVDDALTFIDGSTINRKIFDEKRLAEVLNLLGRASIANRLDNIPFMDQSVFHYVDA